MTRKSGTIQDYQKKSSEMILICFNCLRLVFAKVANLLGRNKKGFLTDSFLLEELKTVREKDHLIYSQFLSLPQEKPFLMSSTEGL